jgi:drug/metabolite transporter (DMT)-like permease
MLPEQGTRRRWCGEIIAMRGSEARLYLALCSAVFFWGLSFVATKMALESFPTFTLVFARFALASCLLLVLMTRYGFPRVTRRNQAKLFLTALFEPGLYFLCETLGLQHTTAPKAALIIAVIPVAVVVLAAIFLRERTTLRGVLGIVTTLVGIAVLVGGNVWRGSSWQGEVLGDLLIVGAVLSAACYTVCARDLGRYHSAREITSIQALYGALFFAPACLMELPQIEWSHVTLRSYGALLYLTLFATVGAFLCYNYALVRLPASRAAVFINGIPVVTAAAAWLLLGETLTAAQLGGGALVLFGVYLTNRPRSRSTVPNPE